MDWLNILMLLLLSMMITIDGTILVSILPVCQILCVKLYTLSDEDEVLDSVTQDERSGCILVWDGISTSMRYYATLLHCTVRLRTAAVPNASGIRAVHCWDYNMLSLEQFRANNCRSCDPRNRCRRYNVGNVYITSRPDTAQRAAYVLWSSYSLWCSWSSDRALSWGFIYRPSELAVGVLYQLPISFCHFRTANFLTSAPKANMGFYPSA